MVNEKNDANYNNGQSCKNRVQDTQTQKSLIMNSARKIQEDVFAIRNEISRERNKKQPHMNLI